MGGFFINFFFKRQSWLDDESQIGGMIDEIRAT